MCESSECVYSYLEEVGVDWLDLELDVLEALPCNLLSLTLLARGSVAGGNGDLYKHHKYHVYVVIKHYRHSLKRSLHIQTIIRRHSFGIL